jgi:hypothetical protein
MNQISKIFLIKKFLYMKIILISSILQIQTREILKLKKIQFLIKVNKRKIQIKLLKLIIIFINQILKAIKEKTDGQTVLDIEAYIKIQKIL